MLIFTKTVKSINQIAFAPLLLCQIFKTKKKMLTVKWLDYLQLEYINMFVLFLEAIYKK